MKTGDPLKPGNDRASTRMLSCGCFRLEANVGQSTVRNFEAGRSTPVANNLQAMRKVLQIYKLEDGEGWTLELVDDENSSTVWEDLFPTDEAARQEFEAGVRDLGLRALLRADDGDDTTVHSWRERRWSSSTP